MPTAVALKIQERQEELSSRGFTLDVPKSLPMEEERYVQELLHGQYQATSGMTLPCCSMKQAAVLYLVCICAIRTI